MRPSSVVRRRFSRRPNCIGESIDLFSSVDVCSQTDRLTLCATKDTTLHKFYSRGRSCRIDPSWKGFQNMVSNSNEVPKRRFSMSPYLLPSVVAAVSFVSCCLSGRLVAQSPERNTFRMERQATVLFDQKRFSEARPLFEQACAAGRWDSCDKLTVMYIVGLGGLSRGSSMAGGPFSEAVPVFEIACANGQADACCHLGWMYKNGIGVSENWSLFFSYSSKACDGGDGFACLNVGVEYEVGGGTKQDYSRAAVIYARSCNAGNAIGCQDLGSLYHRGLGVARDDSRAKELFSKACKLGSSVGCTELKNMSNGRPPIRP